jgi:predicted Zn-dependent peptidase
MTVEVSGLPNGIRVVTHAMPHLESVAVGLWIGAGARSETPQEHGISHLLEHMAFKGTERRSARDIAEEIEAVGGDMNAETNVEYTNYYLRLLKDDMALGLDVLGDVVCNPKLDAGELALEQHVIVQEIGAAQDVPEDWVFELFQESAYPDQAMGRSVLGTPETVRAHTPSDLRRYLGQHYCGPQIVVAGAGNLDHGEVVRLAERHFQSLPSRMPVPYEPANYRGGEWTEARPIQEAQILVGFAAPPFRDTKAPACHVFSAVLGGGMASRLFQELRENRGLCYSINSFYWPYLDSGIFGVQTATSGEDVPELVPLMVDELRKMIDGVTDAELNRAKVQLRASLLMSLESLIARARQMARHMLTHGRPLSMEEMVARIEAVGHRDLRDLAMEILSSRPTLAAIGPLDGLPDVEAITAQIGGHKAAVGF